MAVFGIFAALATLFAVTGSSCLLLRLGLSEASCLNQRGYVFCNMLSFGGTLKRLELVTRFQKPRNPYRVTPHLTAGPSVGNAKRVTLLRRFAGGFEVNRVERVVSPGGDHRCLNKL